MVPIKMGLVPPPGFSNATRRWVRKSSSRAGRACSDVPILVSHSAIRGLHRGSLATAQIASAVHPPASAALPDFSLSSALRTWSSVATHLCTNALWGSSGAGSPCGRSFSHATCHTCSVTFAGAGPSVVSRPFLTGRRPLP